VNRLVVGEGNFIDSLRAGGRDELAVLDGDIRRGDGAEHTPYGAVRGLLAHSKAGQGSAALLASWSSVWRHTP